MPAAGRRLAVLGGILLVGNAGVLALAGWLGGPAEIGRQIILLCSL